MALQKNEDDKEYLEKELLRPYYHQVKIGDHGLYSEEIVKVFQYWLKIPDDKFKAIQDFMKTFVNFTLLFDNIQDNTTHKGILPTSHFIYGVPLTLNTVLHLMGICIEKLQNLGHPQVMDIFNKYYLEMMRGQGEHILFREHLRYPTEEHFKKNAEKKASVILLLCCLLMQLFSKNKTDYSKLTSLLGIYYVIRDDYFNITKHDEENESRYLQSVKDENYCEDLTDGKFTWPVIHALQTFEGQSLIYLLKQQTRDMGMRVYYRSMLERLGSIEYTRVTLESYEAEIREEVARLGGNPVLENRLDKMKDMNK